MSHQNVGQQRFLVIRKQKKMETELYICSILFFCVVQISPQCYSYKNHYIKMYCYKILDVEILKNKSCIFIPPRKVYGSDP